MGPRWVGWRLGSLVLPRWACKVLPQPILLRLLGVSKRELEEEAVVSLLTTSPEFLLETLTPHLWERLRSMVERAPNTYPPKQPVLPGTATSHFIALLGLTPQQTIFERTTTRRTRKTKQG